MTKQEYFTLLLKRDLIRYVLLRKPRLTPSEVSQRLKRRIDADRLNRLMKDAIAPTLDRHLSIHKIMDKNGDVPNRLPDWLNPGLADSIVSDFQNRIAGLCDAPSLIRDILAQAERLTWLQGVDGMAKGLRVFIADIRRHSKDYAGIKPHSPEEYDLQKKYEAARHISITERILGNNDIVLFRGVLMAYAQSACETAIHRQLATLYATVADSQEIARVAARFEAMAEQAKAAQAACPEHPAGWDDEYSRLVPVDFFERNIEDIDAAMAFHMVLLQAFARHESELREEKLISNAGELNLFLNDNFPNYRLLIKLITE